MRELNGQSCNVGAGVRRPWHLALIVRHLHRSCPAPPATPYNICRICTPALHSALTQELNSLIAPACSSLEHDLGFSSFMAWRDPRCASIVADGVVDCSPASKEVVLEIKLLNFINEFLFTQTEDCAHVVIPRHLLTRSKRYRNIWRSAARSITRNYLSDSESIKARSAEIDPTIKKSRTRAAMPEVHSAPDLEGIPFRNADRDGRDMKCKPDIESGGCFTTDSDSKQGVHAPCYEGEELLTKTTVPQSCSSSQPTRYLKQQIERQPMIGSHLNRGYFSPQSRQDTRTHCANVEPRAMELLTPVCRVKIDHEVEGQPTAQCTQVSSIEADPKLSRTVSGAQVPETVPASFSKEITKPSCKKPPRPPRPSTSHPNSYQTSQVRGAKKPRVENRITKRRKSATSGFSTPSLLALIVTLCFAVIMVVQGFLGNSNVRVDNSKATVGPVAQRDFLTLPGEMPKLSPDQETWSHMLSGIQASTAESGPGLSSVFVDQRENNQPGIPELVSTQSLGKKIQETIKRLD